METIIYLISNASTLKGKYESYAVDEPNQVKSEKVILSVAGEEEAHNLSKKDVLQRADVLYSSGYVKALSTAKYFAIENDISIHVDARLNERRLGQLGNLDGLDFYRRQEHDFDFKLHGGESLNEVKKRMVEVIKEILSLYPEERIIVCTHNGAISALLSTWCEIGYNLDERLILDYHGNALVDGALESPCVFQLTFEKETLKDIRKMEV